MKPAYLLAGGVLAISLIATLVSFSGAVANTVSAKQAIAQPGRNCQVAVEVLKNTVRYDAAKGQLQFDGRCRKDGTLLKVIYNQPKPENFDTAVDVQAVGTVRNGVFVAQNLLIKCPSKYSDEEAKAAAKKA